MKKHLHKILFLFATVGVMQAQNPGNNYLEFTDNNGRQIVQTTFFGVSGSASRTVEAWVKVDNGFTGKGYIADWGLNASGQRYTFAVSGGNPRIEVRGSGFTVDTPINDGNWHHLAVVYDNDAVSNKHIIYVDGVVEWTGDLTQEINTSSDNALRIGVRQPNSGDAFEGGIEELRVWNDVRTLTEINDNKNIELVGNESGLVAYYKFNGTGQTIIDSSTNGNNGTLGVDENEGDDDPTRVTGASLSVTSISKNEYKLLVSNGVLNISTEFEMSNVGLFNLLGQTIISSKLEGKIAKINLSSLNSGIYIVKLKDVKGNVGSTKIIIE